MTKNGPKILLLDIETAPHKVYSWGLFKQNISINQIEEPGHTLCWSAKWYKSREIMFGSLPEGREKMVKNIHNLLSEADAVITYNGDRFDLPILNQEFLLLELAPPSPYKTIDLLKTTRREFRLASNKLDYVCEQLGLGNKVRHKGMELWRECMAGVLAAWRKMETYNKRDVRLLERLYERLLPWIRVHPNYALYMDTDRPVCRNCGSHHLQRRGTAKTDTMEYWQYQCQSCNRWQRERKNCLTKDKKEVILV